MNKIVTVAGSDSCGGAGIQADLKVIALMGEYGLSVVTALTAQNTRGVFGIHPVPLDFIASQWDAVVSDINIDAVKTGMLWDERVVSLLAGKIKRSKISFRVFDPVMVSKSGAHLLTKAGQAAFVKEMLSLATIVTPNLPEAGILCGRALRTIGDMEYAARRIHQMGARNVLIKGGHRPGQAVDVLFTGKELYHFAKPRVETIHTHGTGCTYASAIAVEITRNQSLPKAVEKAKEFVTAALESTFPLGHGQGPTNPYAPLARDAELYRCSRDLQEAFQKLQGHNVGPLIPEVQSNLGYALPSAHSVYDIIAFPGRMVRYKDTVATIASPQPGGSQHIAQIILTVMKYDPRYRSAMNIRYDQEVLRKGKRHHWVIKMFDRREEPDKIKRKEGASLEWGSESVLQKCSSIPDMIYDTGDMGKEPMVRILGKTPEEVVNKVLCLI
jgi:hydroxymethylpyrimidine kinase / phosphomethylpyrimidine kinase / thiamine-phosphate diphosphorylase